MQFGSTGRDRQTYVRGPERSRRLGRSLAVNLIPAGTCSYSCIYCPAGETSSRQVTRVSVYPREAILAGLERALEAADHVDYIAFTGPGEPTLCADLGWIVEQCRRRWSLPLAVRTNGSLLIRDDVRAELAGVRVVLSSLDAATLEVFSRVNQPHRAISLRRMLDGLVAFCLETRGQIWLEVVMLPGINDSDRELRAISLVIDEVQPDRVYLKLPDYRALMPQRVLKVCAMLGGARLLAGPSSGVLDAPAVCWAGDPAGRR